MAMDTSKEKKDSNIPIDNNQELPKPSIGYQASQSVVERQEGNGDNAMGANTINVTMHSVLKVTDNESKKSTIKDSENFQSDSQAEGSSKKKRRKRRKKSALDTSEPFACEHELHKPSSSNRASDKDAECKLGRENKALEHIELIFQRILEIESESTEFTLKKPTVVKKSRFSEKGKRDLFVRTKEEKKLCFADDDKSDTGDMPFESSEINSSVRPVIFVMDKATQTDSVPVTSNISKSTDDKSSTTKISYSNYSEINKPTESVLNFEAKVLKPVNDSEDIVSFQDKTDFNSILSSPDINLQSISSNSTTKISDPTADPKSISKSSNDKKTITSDFDDSVLTKQTESNLDKTTDERQPETDSKLTSTLQNKKNSFSNTSSPDVTSQSINTCSRSSKRIRLDPEPQSISKSMDIKSKAILKSDSDGPISNKPKEISLHFSDFGINPENASFDIATFHAETDSSIGSKTSQVNKSESLNFFKSTHGKTSTLLKSPSDGQVANVLTKFKLIFAEEEPKPQKASSHDSNFQSKTDSFSNFNSPEVPLQSITIPGTSTEPKPQSISKLGDGKNSTLLKSDSDVQFINKATESNLQTTASEIKAGTVPDQITPYQNHPNTVSSLSSPEETLQSMTEELLRNLEIVSKDLEEGFTKFLKLSK